MCPNKSMDTPRGFMDIDIFKDILPEAIELGVNQVGLHTTGEPILHPHIVDFIIHSKQTGGLYTYMDVNGNTLNESMVSRIIDAGLDSLKFSIDAHNEEIYSQIRCGGHFKQVYNNVLAVDRIKKQKKSKMRLSVLYTMMNINERYVDDFKNLFRPYVDEIEISFVMNQGAQVDAKHLAPTELQTLLSRHRKNITCPNPWTRIVVAWNGNLTACCIDFSMNMTYGKYEKGKLRSLWNNDIINRIRQNVAERNFIDLKLCNDCDMNRYDIPALIRELNEKY